MIKKQRTAYTGYSACGFQTGVTIANYKQSGEVKTGTFGT